MGGKAKNGKRMSVRCAHALISRFVTKLSRARVIKKVEIAGSLRRRFGLKSTYTVGDLDLVVIPADGFKEFLVAKCGASPTAEKKFSVSYNGAQIDILCTTAKSWGAALMHATGPHILNIDQRGFAKSKGLKLNEYGLFDSEGKFLAGRTEDEIYKYFNAAVMPPADREYYGQTHQMPPADGHIR